MNHKIKTCAWCKEIKTEADTLVSGSMYDDNGNIIPFKAWLCEMHLNDDRIIKKRFAKKSIQE